MRRRRRADGGALGDVLDGLYRVATHMPWYIDAILAIVSYFGLHYLATKYAVDGVHGGAEFLVAVLALIGQYLLTGVFVVGGIVSLFHSFRNGLRGRELLLSSATRNAAQVSSRMNWLDFERLVGEWFQKQGYEVTQAGGADTGKAHADGGIDIELHKDGELFLVQCKHYRSWKVPVETVRDLYGVMTSRGAAGGFVVTSGRFTEPAKEFAAGRSITLIDGEQLSPVLGAAEHVAQSEPAASNEHQSLVCPACGSVMVLRTANRGENKGKQFWGCSQYPTCKQIVQVS